MSLSLLTRALPVLLLASFAILTSIAGCVGARSDSTSGEDNLTAGYGYNPQP